MKSKSVVLITTGAAAVAVGAAVAGGGGATGAAAAAEDDDDDEARRARLLDALDAGEKELLRVLGILLGSFAWNIGLERCFGTTTLPIYHDFTPIYRRYIKKVQRTARTRAHYAVCDPCVVHILLLRICPKQVIHISSTLNL